MTIKLYIVSLIVFMLIDFIWLGLIAKNFYQEHVGFLMRSKVNWVAAVVFYLLFVFGLVFFVIEPSIEQQSLLTLLFRGALFGLITYATYDLTNLATLKNWSLIVTIVDLIWGMVVSVSVSLITYLMALRFFF